jgi:hypothetical protein
MCTIHTFDGWLVDAINAMSSPFGRNMTFVFGISQAFSITLRMRFFCFVQTQRFCTTHHTNNVLEHHQQDAKSAIPFYTQWFFFLKNIKFSSCCYGMTPQRSWCLALHVECFNSQHTTSVPLTTNILWGIEWRDQHWGNSFPTNQFVVLPIEQG